MSRPTEVTLVLLGIVASVGLGYLIARYGPHGASRPADSSKGRASFTLKLEPVFVYGPALTANSIPIGEVGHCGNEVDDWRESGCPIADTALLWKKITEHDTGR